MARTVGIGIQDFGELREKQLFYIDKTALIKEWWESEDSVTLITRPRRFGKTINMSMIEQFFSLDYAGRGDLFEGLSIWKEEKYHQLQGTYPVISLSFSRVKEKNYETTREKICQIITRLYIKHAYLKESDVLTDVDKAYFNRMLELEIRDSDITSAIHQLSDYLQRYYGKKVIILLDEYDTPMQEAYVNGFWDEMIEFIRSLFNSTFKTNPYMERGIMTGITWYKADAPSSLGSKEPCQVNEVGFPTRFEKTSPSSQCQSVFSDLNNLEVVTTTSNKYATSFGFTEEEVFAALDECGLEKEKEEVKRWYDGFVFGQYKDIYNPWSILNFLAKGKYETYWANTSSNRLVGKLIREGSHRIKQSFEKLLSGEHLRCPIDEQIVYNQLDHSESAIWSLLLASGYLKVLAFDRAELLEAGEKVCYELALTNYEVRRMFEGMVSEWFMVTESAYQDFVQALLIGDLDAMNEYMNEITCEIFSNFDTGKRASKKAQPERFYHGFVLGLLVDLRKQYIVTSNRESGFGRYDVMLEPKNIKEDVAVIIEFKVFNARKEESLEDTLASALNQIEEKQYASGLIAKGVPKEHIRKYGFAFEGKTVLIGE